MRSQAREELRKALGVLAEDVNDQQATKLLSVTGWDADLAATAAMMVPRPQWVAKILGPLTTARGV